MLPFLCVDLLLINKETKQLQFAALYTCSSTLTRQVMSNCTGILFALCTIVGESSRPIGEKWKSKYHLGLGEKKTYGLEDEGK
jgi:hypothetical protein